MGLLLQIVIGGLVFYFIAIIFIGPAIVPGLMIGILLMIVGVSLLGLSNLSIDVSTFNILNSGFIIRLVVFTIVVLSLAILFEVLRRKYEKFKGLLMAIEAGLILSLNTVWASPGTTVVTHVVDGIIIHEEIRNCIWNCNWYHSSSHCCHWNHYRANLA